MTDNYYIIEYRYSALGGVEGSLKREVAVGQEELAKRLYDKQTSARCRDISVIKVTQSVRSTPKVKLELKVS